MALQHRRKWLTLFTVLSVAAGFGWSFAQPGGKEAAPDPVTLLPQEALIFFTADGHAEHAATWEQTAAHQALDQSGLTALLDKVFDAAQHFADQEGGGPMVELARTFLAHLREHGVSFVLTVSPPQGAPPTGYAILVLHQAAEFEAPVSELIQAASDGELEFNTIDQAGRNVTFALVPNSPGVEVGWWQERGHLVVVAGIKAVESALAVAQGEAPNATAHPLYKKYVAREHDFDLAASGWFDAKSFRTMVAPVPLPIETGPNAPGPLTVGEVIKLLGLSNLDAVVGVSGYKGQALWSESWVEAPGERTGLLGVGDGAPLTLADLPPLPAALNSFTATRIQFADFYDEALASVYQLARFAPSPDAASEVDEVIAQVNAAAGVDLRQDLIAHLGDVIVGYDDSQQGLFNMGAGFLIRLRDAEAFKASLDQVITAAEAQSEGQFLARRIERRGRELVLLEMYPSAFGYSYCIADDWLVLGSPQVIEAYLLRVDGHLPRWTPTTEHQAALDAVPAEFSGIAVSDPRDFINLLSGLAPLVIGFAETGARASGDWPEGLEFPIHVEDFPPAVLVSRPLFPNVATVQVTEEGFHSRSRMSLPAIPLVGSGDAVTTTAVVAVGVALLLPAVQQARSAARRSQSQNNLRQLALGLHNYHDAHNRLPAGTILNADLEPEDRLSWVVELLPYLEQAPLYNQIDRAAGWKQGDNLTLAAIVLELLINPGEATGPTTFDGDGNILAVTQYVGVGGLGEDGPTLPANNPKAGIFGYDRKTRFADVTDGLSNTLAIGEATGEFGGWMQGGRATVRPFTQQPYINGPDGIGGPYPGGANFSLGDGAVRFISQDIDAGVLEALTTISGGEVVGEF